MPPLGALSCPLYLLRQVFKWHPVPAWDVLIDGFAQVFPVVLAEREGDDRADHDATDATNRDTFEKHAVTKKCHR
jgi:hypothetical protein